MSARLSDQDWLADPALHRVFEALDGQARVVGGCVRNALMGFPIDDVDVATPLTPDAVTERLKAAGLKAVPTGIEHGTITAVADRRPFEITTLRRDVTTDGRNATVAFTDDWSEDAGRRDFRLNALYADLDGTIFDPTGQGIADAEAGRIVFVGDPETRIREDYLRILRFFRFFAWYGRGEPDAAGLRACAALKDGMGRLSAERVSKELLKLLAAPDPRRTVRLMADAGVLALVLPAAGSLDLFAAMVGVSTDPLLRLSALLPDAPEAVGEAARALRLSNAEKDRLVLAVRDGPLDPGMGDAQARASLYRLGRARFEDQARRAQAAGGDVSRLLDLAAAWPSLRMPVDGHAAKAAGATDGLAIGRALKAFEAEWIAADFPETGHAERLARIVREQA